MDKSKKTKLIQEAQKNVEQRQQYLNKIPTLERINSIKLQQDVEQEEALNNPADLLNGYLQLLLKDGVAYSGEFNCLSTACFNKKYTCSAV